MPVWDPSLYQTFADHRDRPFHDLVARVGATNPGRVVDLGCGPGSLTLTLADRWPQAQIVGVDSSPQMIAKAEETADGRVSFVEQDLRSWLDACPPASVDVVVSNATLQWVPGHLDLIGQLAGVLRPGGWLAIQVPGNHEAPLHAILRELAGTDPYAEYTASKRRLEATSGQDYLDAFSAAGMVADAWETTYLHVLPGADPVFTWISGTGARPVLQALPEQLRERFEAEFKQRLAQAYPPADYGTVLPFRRVFAVGQRPA